MQLALIEAKIMTLFNKNGYNEYKNKENRFLFGVFILIPVYVCLCFLLFLNKRDAVAITRDYSGKPTIVVDNNKPGFTEEEITDVSFEEYGKLDDLGRCTTAFACVGTDLMPTEDRSSVGEVIPTGFVQNRYPGIVDSVPPFLYNRCYLIAYSLTGESANSQNLITGTRYMNVVGMMPYEEIVTDYINSTGNHVMYRVTPVFEGNNLLCRGVQMEAYSVEDNGEGVCFNVFCFNVQPGIKIDYSDGSNTPAEGVEVAEEGSIAENVVTDKFTFQYDEELLQDADYVVNKNTLKFHYKTCESVDEIYEANKMYYKGSREELIEQGYAPCKRCNP